MKNLINTTLWVVQIYLILSLFEWSLVTSTWINASKFILIVLSMIILINNYISEEGEDIHN